MMMTYKDDDGDTYMKPENEDKAVVLQQLLFVQKQIRPGKDYYYDLYCPDNNHTGQVPISFKVFLKSASAW